MNRLATLLFLLLLLLNLAACSPKTSKEELVLAIHPYLPKQELLDRFSPLADYLSSEMGVKVNIKITETYAEQIDSMGQDKVDLAYMGPTNYIEMTKKYRSKNLLGQIAIKDIPWFYGIIAVKKASPLKKVSELAGKTICFGVKTSTMGFNVPSAILYREGVMLRHLKKFSHYPNHNLIVNAILNGDCDAGGLKEGVFERYNSKGIRELARSVPIASHIFVARSTMPSEQVKQIKQLLLKIHQQPEGKWILSSIRQKANQIVFPNDINYNTLRKILAQKNEIER